MLGKKHECAKCHTSETSLWKKVDNDRVLCNDCATNKTTCLPPHKKSRSSSPDQTTESDSISQPHLKLPGPESEQSISLANREDEREASVRHREDQSRDEADGHKDDIGGGQIGFKSKSNKEKPRKDELAEDKDDTKRETRRKTRKGKQGSKGSVPKGKGRRYIFKKSATKAPLAVSVPITTESLLYKGQYYQLGDIVSVEDVEGGLYYGQVRGLLQDQYCEKSAVLTWLLPTTSSPLHRFDPSTYIIGPEEELPRKLEYLEFVCHAPSDYYKQRNSPYPTAPSVGNHACYVWARIGQPQATTLEHLAEAGVK